MEESFFLLVCCLWLLAFDDGTSGAYASAGAAAYACVGVNFIDVALGDCSNGAFVDAGAASSADVSDFVSHVVCFLG